MDARVKHEHDNRSLTASVFLILRQAQDEELHFAPSKTLMLSLSKHEDKYMESSAALILRQAQDEVSMRYRCFVSQPGAI